MSSNELYNDKNLCIMITTQTINKSQGALSEIKYSQSKASCTISLP